MKNEILTRPYDAADKQRAYKIQANYTPEGTVMDN